MHSGFNELEGGVRLIQVYTGCGKGKTTAALGLALRSAGAGFFVYICQFAKGRFYSELRLLKKIKNIEIEQFGRRCFIKKKPAKIDIELACKGLENAKRAILNKKFRLIILDEINIALNLNLISLKEVIEMLKTAPKNKEIVLTGRYAPLQIIDAADLVSQIQEIKHYYKKGIKARKGIEF